MGFTLGGFSGSSAGAFGGTSGTTQTISVGGGGIFDAIATVVNAAAGVWTGYQNKAAARAQEEAAKLGLRSAQELTKAQQLANAITTTVKEVPLWAYGLIVVVGVLVFYLFKKKRGRR